LANVKKGSGCRLKYSSSKTASGYGRSKCFSLEYIPLLGLRKSGIPAAIVDTITKCYDNFLKFVSLTS